MKKLFYSNYSLIVYTIISLFIQLINCDSFYQKVNNYTLDCFYQKVNNYTLSDILKINGNHRDFACYEDQCYVANSITTLCQKIPGDYIIGDEFYSIPKKENITNNPLTIMDGYDEKYFKDMINNKPNENSDKCNINSDCITNNCKNGYCVIEKGKSLIWCTHPFDKYYCGLVENSHCDNDDENMGCYFSYCHPEKNVCDVTTPPSLFFDHTSENIVIAMFFFFVVVIILAFVCCIFWCIKTRCCFMIKTKK